MKRVFCILLALVMVALLCGCGRTRVSSGAQVTLNFVYADQDIHMVLPEEEAARVIEILDGKAYDPIGSGTPSCGFSKDISLSVDGHVYAIARDTCAGFQDMGNLRYATISQEQIGYIHSLFEKYGGYFPCI
jgi:hypothetical protein